MKRTIMNTLLCSTLIISLTGCGVGNVAENRTAKGESKAETTGKELRIEESETAKVISSVYPNYCTDNYYYGMDGMDIVQCDLDGNELQKFKMPAVDGKNKDEEIADLYVTDEEILYTVYCDDDKSGEYGLYEQLCSVPVWRENREEQLLVDQVEKLFREDDGLELLYADKQVVGYSPGMDGYVYCEYDRINKKQIPISKGDKDVYYDFPLGKYGTWDGYCCETVLLARYGKNETPEDTDDHGIYVHIAGSQEIKKVATHYIDRYSGGLNIASADGKVYYTCIHDSYTDKYEHTDKYSYDIWCYDSATGENRIFVSEEEIKKTEPEFEDINNLFADGDSLYAYGSKGKEEEREFVIRISQTADGKVEVEPEKELEQALYSYEVSEIEDIAGDKCYCILYEEDEEDEDDDVEKHYVFDLSSKELKEVTEGDPEYYFWKYDKEFDDED